MRKIILISALLTFGLTSNIMAFQLPSGGEITYRHVAGSSTSHYIITYTHYALENSTRQDTQVQIGIHSSCDTGGIYWADLVNNSPISGALINPTQACLGPGSTPTHLYKMWIYELDVVLPVHCSDWEFFTNAGVRNDSVTNLVNPDGKNFLIKASLNSFYPNTSPTLPGKGAREFCAGSTGTIPFSQSVIEPDGDSIVWYFSEALEGPFPGIPMLISNGYSLNTPFASPSGWNPTDSAILIFKPINVEMVNFKISLDEFRFDTNLIAWVKIGTISKEIQIQTSGNCSLAAMDLSFQTNQIAANCGDTKLSFTTSSAVSPHSISPDGTDFIIITSHGTPMPIVSANVSNSFINTIDINLLFPLIKNDTLQIISKIGSDLNTLINYCGYALKAGDSISAVVSDCLNMGLKEEDRISHIYPNPTNNFAEVEFKTVGQKTISLYNSNGKIVRLEKVSLKKYKINLEGLPNGIYLIQIDHFGHIETEKILKN